MKKISDYLKIGAWNSGGLCLVMAVMTMKDMINGNPLFLVGAFLTYLFFQETVDLYLVAKLENAKEKAKEGN